eukprot:2922735-Prymnesium_polylepis.1
MDRTTTASVYIRTQHTGAEPPAVSTGATVTRGTREGTRRAADARRRTAPTGSPRGSAAFSITALRVCRRASTCRGPD